MSRISCQMIRVISSPSSSTTGLATLILDMERSAAGEDGRRCKGRGFWRQRAARPRDAVQKTQAARPACFLGAVTPMTEAHSRHLPLKPQADPPLSGGALGRVRGGNNDAERIALTHVVAVKGRAKLAKIHWPDMAAPKPKGSSAGTFPTKRLRTSAAKPRSPALFSRTLRASGCHRARFACRARAPGCGTGAAWSRRRRR